MQKPPSDPIQAAQLRHMVHSLNTLRDALMTISLALTDLITEVPSTDRDEVLAGVERYLSRFARSDTG